MKKLLSRKFLISLAGSIVGILVMALPQYSEQISQTTQMILGTVLVALSNLGYIAAEAHVDAADAKASGEKAKANAAVQAAKAGKTLPVVLACLLVLGGALGSAGCSTLTGRTYENDRAALQTRIKDEAAWGTLALDATYAALESGRITAADVRSAKPAIDNYVRTVNLAQAYYDAGDTELARATLKISDRVERQITAGLPLLAHLTDPGTSPTPKESP